MGSQVKLQKPVWITPARLKSERGWTDGLIKRYLGEPDKLVPNPHYRRARAKMRLYDLARVVQAEEHKKALKEVNATNGSVEHDLRAWLKQTRGSR